jgi:hypothetical protein
MSRKAATRSFGLGMAVSKDIDWDYVRQEFPDVDFSTTETVDAALGSYFARLRRDSDTQAKPGDAKQGSASGE